MCYITFSVAAGLVYPGAWSDSQQIKVQRDCHLLQPVILQHSRKMALNLNAGVIAGEEETHNDYFRCDNIQNSSTNRHKDSDWINTFVDNQLKKQRSDF